MESRLKRVPRTCWTASRRIVRGNVPHSCIILAFVLTAYPCRHTGLKRRRNLRVITMAWHSPCHSFRLTPQDFLPNLWRHFSSDRHFALRVSTLCDNVYQNPAHLGEIGHGVYKFNKTCTETRSMGVLYWLFKYLFLSLARSANIKSEIMTSIDIDSKWPFVKASR